MKRFVALLAVGLFVLVAVRVYAQRPVAKKESKLLRPAAKSTKPAKERSEPPATPAGWQSLIDDLDIEDSTVAGRWQQTEDGLRVSAATGARLILPAAPRGEYDVRMSFTRHRGVHSIALFFPHGEGQGSFEVDAWGEHLGGIQNISGQSIRANPTRHADLTLTNGTRYTMTVEVRANQVRALLDDRVIATHRTTGSDLSVPDLWALPDRSRLGVGAWDSEATFHAIEIRMVGDAPLQVAKAARPAKPSSAPASKKRPIPTPAATKKGGADKHVLLVIANRDFFYREYADPRSELERAGIRVTVAAGQRAPCTPHTSSGEGSDRGVVNPDIALADANASDYDAILFSGGWGSSCYQYAFEGRYNNPVYNGNRAIKTAANRLISEFLEQDKYVCALCNAVSVIAWARVNGQSPLRGKRVCAPTRQAAAGIYDGQPAQPSCRWHPEANGAILSPAGALGRPGTAEDDVMVDGKIVTGEDDISAREMGRRMVQLLTAN